MASKYTPSLPNQRFASGWHAGLRAWAADYHDYRYGPVRSQQFKAGCLQWIHDTQLLYWHGYYSAVWAATTLQELVRCP